MNLPQSVVRLAIRARPHVPPGAWDLAVATASLVAGPPTISGPPAGPLLAVAPHPDDETIGCGGTLALAAARGEVVQVVLVTDGEATVGGGDRRAIGSARRRETYDACRHLGISPPVALGLPDGGVADVADDLVRGLGRVVARIGPRTILCPWPHDRHVDHRAVARAVTALDLPATVQIWGYEAHVPLPPNAIVDITPVIDRKRAALAAHRTAGLAMSLEATLGLNRWRSLAASQGNGYAEAFLAAPAPSWPTRLIGPDRPPDRDRGHARPRPGPG